MSNKKTNVSEDVIEKEIYGLAAPLLGVYPKGI